MVFCGQRQSLFIVHESYNILKVKEEPKPNKKIQSTCPNRNRDVMVTITIACNAIMKLSDHTSWFLSGHVTQKVLWPPATSKYGGLRPRIWVYVTSKILLPLATTNCGGLWPQKSKVSTVGYPNKWSACPTLTPSHSTYRQT